MEHQPLIHPLGPPPGARRRHTAVVVGWLVLAAMLGGAIYGAVRPGPTATAGRPTSRSTTTTHRVLAFTPPTTAAAPATTDVPATTAAPATTVPATVPTTAAPTTVATTAPVAPTRPSTCYAIPTGASRLGSGCWIESAANGAYFVVGSGTPAAGSATATGRNITWGGLTVYGQPTATGAVLTARLVNQSQQTMTFPGGLSVTAALTLTGARPVTVRLSDPSVTSLAPAATANLSLPVQLSPAGTYSVTGWLVFTVS